MTSFRLSPADAWFAAVAACLIGTTAAGHDHLNLSPSTDRVVLVDNRSYEGLVESEDGAWVNLIQMERSRGRMHLVIRPIERSRVATVVRLDDAKRDALRRQIEAFRNRAAIEAGRIDKVELQSSVRDGRSRFRYQGKWFALESTLDEETTRQVVVRVEQMFTAYRQVLPPRNEPAQRLTLSVYGALSEYREHLARLGMQHFDRPACFVLDDNHVLAGSDLNRSAAQFQQFKAQNANLQRELRLLERELKNRLNDKARQMQQAGIAADEIGKTLTNVRQELEKQISAKRVEIQRVDRQNQQLFDRLAGQMFAQIYHEAFHAYLENCVYPRQRYETPLWLNEGLAQLFESAQPQSTSLRVDSPDAALLKRLKADLSGPAPLSLDRVLAADAPAFLSSAEAPRLYLYAWGLVYYLTFEQPRVPSSQLDGYVALEHRLPATSKANGHSDATRLRFERLVDRPLGEFEPRWRKWVLEQR